MSIIPALGRLRQEAKASLGYIASSRPVWAVDLRSCLKETKQQKDKNKINVKF
jgi:hypothetical protein